MSAKIEDSTPISPTQDANPHIRSMMYGRPNMRQGVRQDPNIQSLLPTPVAIRPRTRRIAILRTIFDSDKEIEKRTGKTIEEIKKGAHIDPDIIADKLAENDAKTREAGKTKAIVLKESTKTSKTPKRRKKRKINKDRKRVKRSEDEVKGR